MIKCIAIDDEPRALDVIRHHIDKIDFVSLEETFTDPLAALNYLSEHKTDLVFLDIDMPNISGIDLLKSLKEKPLVIFTTAHSEYAIESYELSAIDYLLKPFDFPRFLNAVLKAQSRLKDDGFEKSRDFFFINTGTQKRKMFYQEIRFVEGEGNYVRYYTGGEKLLVRSTIRKTLEQLPQKKFVQIHRSYIVALQWIDSIEDNHVQVGSKRITIGATYRNDFLKIINALK